MNLEWTATLGDSGALFTVRRNDRREIKVRKEQKNDQMNRQCATTWTDRKNMAFIRADIFTLLSHGRGHA